jgi:nucleoid DNA-binding protein
MTNTTDLAARINVATGLDMKVAKQYLREFRQIIVEETDAGRSITINGFGTFRPYAKVFRNRTNPRTKAHIGDVLVKKIRFDVSPELQKVLT